jgi:hypothetical protein
MPGRDEDWDRSRRLGAEDREWSSTGQVFGGRTIERLGDAVGGLHRAQRDEERGFLSLASKPRSMVSLDLASNQWLRFLWFGLKTTRSGILLSASKPVATV